MSMSASSEEPTHHVHPSANLFFGQGSPNCFHSVKLLFEYASLYLHHNRQSAFFSHNGSSRNTTHVSMYFAVGKSSGSHPILIAFFGWYTRT